MTALFRVEHLVGARQPHAGYFGFVTRGHQSSSARLCEQTARSGAGFLSNGCASQHARDLFAALVRIECDHARRDPLAA